MMKKMLLLTIVSLPFLSLSASISGEEFVERAQDISTKYNRTMQYKDCITEKSSLLTYDEKMMTLDMLEKVLFLTTPPLDDDKKTKAAQLLMNDSEETKAFRKYVKDVVNACKSQS